MKLLASCEDTGSLKLVIAKYGTDTSKQASVQPEEILSLASEGHSRHSKILQLVQNTLTNHIITTRLDGSLQCYEFESASNELKLLHENKNVLEPFSKGENEERFVSLEIANDFIYAGSNKGQIFIWKSEESIVNTPLVYKLPLTLESNLVNSIKVHHGDGDLIVIGGDNIDLSIFKLPSLKLQSAKPPTLIFKAKNLHDKILDMKMKINITDIQIDDDSTPDNFKIFTFTAFGELRFYESKLGKKPRWNHLVLPQKSSIVTSVKLENSEEMIISDMKAQTIKINSKSGEQICKFKGQFGTIQSLSIFKNKILATGGLDRYVRAYFIDSRECIVKVYLGTQVNNVLILEDDQFREQKLKRKEEKVKIINKEEEEKDEEDDDDDEMWTKLESNLTQRNKRRKLIN